MPGDGDARRDAFRVLLAENGYVRHVEKAPASWEAGDILQTRPAGLVV